MTSKITNKIASGDGSKSSSRRMHTYTHVVPGIQNNTNWHILEGRQGHEIGR